MIEARLFEVTAQERGLHAGTEKDGEDDGETEDVGAKRLRDPRFECATARRRDCVGDFVASAGGLFGDQPLGPASSARGTPGCG